MTHLLEIVPMLRTLPALVREQFQRQVKLRHCPRGGVLFKQDGEPRSVIAVLAGRVALERSERDGARRAVCFITAGGFCCCATALDGGPYPASASAAPGSTIAQIPCSYFRELLLTQPGFADGVMRQIGRQLRQCRCDGSPRGAARVRIAGKLLAAVAQFGTDVPLTRREIAGLAGTTVETAIRETRNLEEAGWVSLERGHVRVLDENSLRMIASGDDPAKPAERKRPARSPRVPGSNGRSSRRTAS